MKNNFRFLIVFLIFVFNANIFAVEKLSLNENWFFAYQNKWFKAVVPGVIHTDLLSNKLIPDPFIGENEKKIEWIDKKEWIYKKNFDVDKNILKNKNIELVFEGIDTYSKIFLNDSIILETNNMFREWRADLKNILREKNNEIKIIFTPALFVDSVLESKLNYKLPQDSRTFSRKAQFQYGWDFAPKFVTCGVWKNVYLETWSDAKIKSIHFSTISLDSTKANTNFKFEIFSSIDTNYKIKINSLEDSTLNFEKIISINKGLNEFEFKLEIPNPQLWWCNGYGKQNLYNFICTIENDSIIDKKIISIGIRKIELIQKEDSVGTSFYFSLNGIPVFIKGANYVPIDMFPSRNNFSDYENLILKVKKANMNMLRVWGGGVYADDEFYNLCDKNGILVWQDFMFANSMVPGDSLFFENVKIEASEQISRLRNHPSLALWCGNNEVEEGWYNWGWQNQFKYSENDAKNIWNDYKKIFHQLLPELILNLNPEINYISSSPKIGWGNKESLFNGDMHYWGVWWGSVPFEEYEKNIPRFMSEFGFQSAPPLKSMNKFVDEQKFTFTSKSIKNHQKHPKGFKIIASYLKKYFRMPRTLTEYVLTTQHLQSFGVSKAIEAHRIAKPICMGTLFWQLNEPWPGFTWSAIDYYGEEKILYKTIQNLYKPFLVSAVNEKTNLNVYIVSDLLIDSTAKLEIILYDLNRKVQNKFSKNILIEKNSSNIYFKISKKTLLGKLNPSFAFLEIKLKNNKNELLSIKKHYFVNPKDFYLNDEDYWKFLKNDYNKY